MCTQCVRWDRTLNVLMLRVQICNWLPVRWLERRMRIKNVTLKIHFRYPNVCARKTYEYPQQTQKKWINLYNIPKHWSWNVQWRNPREVWIKQECKLLYFKRCNIQRSIKVLVPEVAYKLNPIEFDVFDNQVRYRISKIIHTKFITQCKGEVNVYSSEKSIRTLIIFAISLTVYHV